MGHNSHMTMDPESLNAAHDTDRKFLDDLSSIGINPKEVKLSGGGAKKVAVEGHMYMAMLTRQNEAKHTAVLAEHADHLANRGVNVTTATYKCGHTRVNLYRTPFGVGARSNYDYPTSNCDSCRTSI